MNQTEKHPTGCFSITNNFVLQDIVQTTNFLTKVSKQMLGEYMAEQMMSGHIVNTVNNGIYRVNNNEQCSNDTKKTKVDVIATSLVDKLNNPDSRKYYCKVAYKLPENIIWLHLETALKGRSPQKYFSWLCNKSMAES
jgi:hypothetical protein